MKALLYLIPSIVLLGLSQAHADSFRYTSFRFNPVMQPKGPIDLVVECGNNALCNGAVQAGAAYFGVDPKMVGAIFRVLAYTYEREGEGTQIWLEPPKGWKYCSVHIKTTSVVPATGDRATSVSFNASRDRVSFDAWTPKRGFGGGRSWYDGVATIKLVRADEFKAMQRSGNCTVPIKHERKNGVGCRGARGINKGQRACGRYTF